MSFPKSKILSPANTVPVSHSVKQETNVNINLNERSASIDEIPAPPAIAYPPINPYADSPNADALKDLQQVNTQLTSTIDFLKGVINTISDIKLKLGNAIVVTDSDLISLIKSLIPSADEITLNYDDDFDAVCCKSGRYSKISSILAVVDGETKNVKYSYPDVYASLQAYGISTKFVRFEA